MIQIQTEVESIADYINGQTQTYQSDVFDHSDYFQIDISDDDIRKVTKQLRGKKAYTFSRQSIALILLMKGYIIGISFLEQK